MHTIGNTYLMIWCELVPALFCPDSIPGILLWELWSGGKTPYPTFTNSQVLDEVCVMRVRVDAYTKHMFDDMRWNRGN